MFRYIFNHKCIYNAMAPCIFYLRLYLYGKNNVNLGQTLDNMVSLACSPSMTSINLIDIGTQIGLVVTQTLDGVVC